MENNEIQVFVAFRRGTAMVMTLEDQDDLGIIIHTGAVPVERVFVEESFFDRRLDVGQVGGSDECFQGMRRRPDSNAWFGECNFRRRRSWKLYRATPWAPRRARVLATSASE